MVGVRLHTPGTSVGIASHSGEDAEIATLLGSADADLYAAKQFRSASTRDPELGHVLEAYESDM